MKVSPAMLACIGVVAVAGSGLYLALPATSASLPAPTPAVAQAAALPPPAPSAATVPPPAIASVDGLILYGVTGGGPGGMAAIIGTATGGQRLVPVGRDYSSGLKVIEVGQTFAVLATGGAPVRLELPLFGAATQQSAVSIAAGQAGPAQVRRDPAGLEYARLHHALKPVMSGGRVGGYAIKPGARVARLYKAGMQAGDVIVGVNGSAFDEERMSELQWQLQNSDKLELEYIHNGKRIKASL